MSSDPDLELQGAIIQTLRADAAVMALVGERVYDRVPEKPTFPYITYGPVDSGSDDAECLASYDMFIQLNTWSRNVGYPECKRINDAVRRALRDADITLTDNALVLLEHQRTQTLRDPDGLTSHGVLTYEAIVEEKG